MDPQLMALIQAYQSAASAAQAAVNAPISQFYELNGWVCFGNPAVQVNFGPRARPQLYQSLTAVADANALNTVMVASLQAEQTANTTAAAIALNNAQNALVTYATGVPISAQPPTLTPTPISLQKVT